MYYDDLALCDYHAGPHHAREWHSPLRAIGWLEHPHPFPTGSIAPEFLETWQRLMAASWEHYPRYAFRGLHDCTLCAAPDRELSMAVHSHENLWIPGNGVIYLAPGMITHYVRDHGYQPPAEFIEAVLRCPDYGSPAYCAALQAANGGHATPLRSKDESAAEWARKRELALARRANRPPPDKPGA